MPTHKKVNCPFFRYLSVQVVGVSNSRKEKVKRVPSKSVVASVCNREFSST